MEVARRRVDRAVESLRAAAQPGPSLLEALRGAPIGLIAEVKRRSPSAGSIREPFDAAAIARAYAQGGAQALSVLVDEPYFGGGEADFRAACAAVSLPLLYKEFVVDPWQIWHAASLGASAVLLIVAALNDRELEDFQEVSRQAGLCALVEVHDVAEARRALATGAVCIGVNNRDLRTFKVSLDTTFHVRDEVPRDVFFVSESGIRTAEDVMRLRQAGVDAVLVGEHLLRQQDLTAAVRGLMGAAWASL